MHARCRWDVFCRVIDNHGDIGVAWRLCADLASRGELVRLWVDKPQALAWMAPQRHPGVEVIAWTDPLPDLAPGDVVVETFGCDPPARFVQRMAERATAPVWINLEYLSAEAYVERSHGLPSPVSAGPGKGLVKRFFYPGFTPRTGGLLREPALAEERQAFDRETWLRAQRFGVPPGHRLVSLFCYDNPALPTLLNLLGEVPTLLLAAPGAAAAQASALLGPGLRRGALQARLLPFLSQPDYDRLLWACDLNFVRGEDSFVRAQWAAKPFVWQVYPQQDGAHAAKLHAFLDRMLAGADPATAASMRSVWLGWNGLGTLPPRLPTLQPWLREARRWCGALRGQADLASQLIRMAAETR